MNERSCLKRLMNKPDEAAPCMSCGHSGNADVTQQKHGSGGLYRTLGFCLLFLLFFSLCIMI